MNHLSIYHRDIPDFLKAGAETALLQRLKKVGMNCGCEYTSFPQFVHLSPYSRYTHSLGVALIVWHFTGDKKQALSGLLHDVASPVFAHVVDFMKGDYLTQEATEVGTKEMIKASMEWRELLRNIPVSGDALTVEDVADYHLYPIADNDSPKLSADRLEYTLGNGINFGFLSLEEAKAIYDDLVVGANEGGSLELVFRSSDKALLFASTALKCSKIYVSDEDRYAMQILSEILKEALRRGSLVEGDLWTEEDRVIQKMCQDEVVKGMWDRFRVQRRMILWDDAVYSGGVPHADTAPPREEVGNPDSVPPREDAVYSDTPPWEEGWRKIYAKKRCVDPLVAGKGRVSRLFPGFGRDLHDFVTCSQEYYMRSEA